jgi:hypothetical protein
MAYTADYVRDVQRKLNVIGVGTLHGPLAVDGSLGPTTKATIGHFQYGWNPAPSARYQWLATDEDPGAKTFDALNLSVYLGGLASPHFRFREVACKHCGYVNVRRELFQALEVYRAAFLPAGMSVLSGCRCKAHNDSVGGADNSQHLYGSAADVKQVRSLTPVKQLRRFSGIELSSVSLVCHVDVRHLTGTNFTGSSVDRPAVFRWATTLTGADFVTAQDLNESYLERACHL